MSKFFNSTADNMIEDADGNKTRLRVKPAEVCM
jgi:hypothetical protein